MVIDGSLRVPSTDGRTFGCFVAAPAGARPSPALVLIQEIFGVNTNMRWTARRFAEAGFVVAVPDLFWRTAPGIELDPGDPAQRTRAMELNGSFNAQSGVSDCRQTAEELRRQVSCNGRVGTIGYCLGGRLAFLMASSGYIDAGVCFYPVAIQPELKSLKVSSVPLLVHLGADDPLCNPQAQTDIKVFVEGQKSNKVTIYKGMGHAFARQGRAGDAAVAAEGAESATIEFLRKYL